MFAGPNQKEHAMPESEKTKLQRRLTGAAEVALVVAILALLAALWLPAWIGAHPGILWR
jgi:hypothetical protein